MIKHGEYYMSITANQIKDLKAYLRICKPQNLKLDGNRTLSSKEAVMQLASELEKMRRNKRYTTSGLVEVLKEIDIHVTAANFNRYLSEARNLKQKRKKPATKVTLSAPEPAKNTNISTPPRASSSAINGPLEKDDPTI